MTRYFPSVVIEGVQFILRNGNRVRLEDVEEELGLEWFSVFMRWVMRYNVAFATESITHRPLVFVSDLWHFLEGREV